MNTKLKISATLLEPQNTCKYTLNPLGNLTRDNILFAEKQKKPSTEYKYNCCQTTLFQNDALLTM